MFIKNKKVPKEQIIYKITKNINDDNNNYRFLNILKYNDITTMEDIYHDDYDFNENLKQFNIGSISDIEFEDQPHAPTAHDNTLHKNIDPVDKLVPLVPTQL